jgi:hypothetical protein
MWDDEINKRIKDAADQYHPAYDENAWDKMNVLLDQHLPVKDKRRRKYFLIPFIALLAGGAFFIIYNKQNSSLRKNSQKAETKATAPATQLPQQKSSSTVVISSPANAKPLPGLNSISASTTNGPGNELKNSNGNRRKNEKGETNATVTIASIENSADTQSNGEKNLKTNEQPGLHENTASETIIVNNQDIKKEIADAKKDSAISEDVAGKQNTKKQEGTEQTVKISKSFRNNFAIDFSAGPDVSSVGFDKTGKIAINYGAGISYGLSARFTLHTGFFVAQKIYSADKYQYHMPPGGYNADYLYSIGADCKVYEIPITVSYNFGKTKNHQWFASAGLSSYLMKKESYDYFYKYPSGNTYTKSWSISNENQNYFSVLDLSAGYQYLFSKRAALLIEPYLKLPVSGVGAGKVKLNSGGVLFTYRLKPFYKK